MHSSFQIIIIFIYIYVSGFIINNPEQIQVTKNYHYLSMNSSYVLDFASNWELSFELKLESGSGTIIKFICWDNDMGEGGWRILFDLVVLVASSDQTHALLSYSVNSISEYDHHKINVTTAGWNKYYIHYSKENIAQFIVEYPSIDGVTSVVHNVEIIPSNLENISLHVGDPWGDTPVAYIQNIMLTNTNWRSSKFKFNSTFVNY